MRSRCVTFLLFVTALSSVSCSRHSGQLAGREALPAVLVVAPAATSIESKREGEVYGLSYVAPVAYPASDLIAQIKSRAQEAGWQPLPEHWLNPGIPSSVVRGWSDYIDKSGTPTTFVHQWQAQWSNSAGDILDYSLWYTSPGEPPYPLPTPNHTSLRVVAEIIPRALAEQARASVAAKQRNG